MSIARLPPFPTIRDIIKLYRLSAIKQLSQNFLMNEQLSDKIVRCTGIFCDSQVLEIGPGPGAITRSIIKKRPRQIVLIEKDERFKPALEMMKVACSGVTDVVDLIFDDIMTVNLTNMFSIESKKEWTEMSPNIFFIGNLPFSISTALLIKWLKNISEQNGAWSFGRVQMTLTFQKEVAERLVAEAGQSQRCRLSVITQAWTIPKLKFIIPASAFVPKPDVDVGVVSLIPLKKPRTHHKFEFFEKINRHIFSFRQKYSATCAG
ncbi:dimethyladenosine transferase 1, mitochondrial [Phymastichus coffea]|uniref:dimethyladenosine transferase 1, mitochondrial n=1 Tax=Phymastichus coffea TaxID=108790 RepID=UPI00273CD4C7|nr:dimethyladenosine transferase 1, mitochondrial [Phymastichus coffea]